MGYQFWGHGSGCRWEDILLFAGEPTIVRTSQVRTTESAVLVVAIDLTNEVFFSICARSPGSTSIDTYGLLDNRIPVAASVLDPLNHSIAHIQ